MEVDGAGSEELLARLRGGGVTSWDKLRTVKQGGKGQ